MLIIFQDILDHFGSNLQMLLKDLLLFVFSFYVIHLPGHKNQLKFGNIFGTSWRRCLGRVDRRCTDRIPANRERRRDQTGNK